MLFHLRQRVFADKIGLDRFIRLAGKQRGFGQHSGLHRQQIAENA